MHLSPCLASISVNMDTLFFCPLYKIIWYTYLTRSLVAQLVKYPPAMWETWVQFLGWEDPLEKGKATHSRILAWRIPWTIQSMGPQRVGHNWETFTSMLSHIVTFLKHSEFPLVVFIIIVTYSMPIFLFRLCSHKGRGFVWLSHLLITARYNA